MTQITDFSAKRHCYIPIVGNQSVPIYFRCMCNLKPSRIGEGPVSRVILKKSRQKSPLNSGP